MVFHFKELDPQQHEKNKSKYGSDILELRADWASLRHDRFRARIQQLDERLDCQRLSPSNDWIISYAEPRLVPFAEWVVSQLREGPRMSVGRPPGSFSEALAAAALHHVDLSTSRIRVGFTRGHLLDVYVLVPMDVSATADELQVAAEVFLETLMGDRVLDVWVCNVAVDRIARSRGLTVLADVTRGSESYPLRQASTLIQRGINALLNELPHSLLEPAAPASDWTALSIDEATDASAWLQPDRRFASTRFPEALKACLMGLPFSSSRFTRGDEIWVWFSWPAPPPEQRMEIRQQVEGLLEPTQPHAHSSRGRLQFVLGGSGFGEKRDYVDLWVRPKTAVLRELGERIAALTGRTTLGFYDSVWADELIEFTTA